MSEQLAPEASRVTITRVRGGWVVSTEGGINTGISIARSPREVILDAAISLGLGGAPKDMKLADASFERALLLLGSIHDQMRRGALMVVGDKNKDTGRVALDKSTTGKVADDIQDALRECGFGDQRPGA